MSRRLFNARATTGSSDGVRIADIVGGPSDVANVQLRGFVSGTFGGTSAQFEYSDQNQTAWFPVGSAITTAGSQDLGRLPITGYLRCTLTGGAGMAITAEAG